MNERLNKGNFVTARDKTVKAAVQARPCFLAERWSDVEVEEDDSLNFLDVTCTRRSDGSVLTSVLAAFYAF